MGRSSKPAEYDLKVVEALAACLCTFEEMAAYLNLGEATVYRLMKKPQGDFAAAVKKGKHYGAASLRRKQYQLALEGNVTMLIWLGKNSLGQKDSPLVEVHNEATAQANFVMNDTVKKKLAEMAFMIRREASAARSQQGAPNASTDPTDFPASGGTN
jgi:hypothetical protein